MIIRPNKIVDDNSKMYFFLFKSIQFTLIFNYWQTTTNLVQVIILTIIDEKSFSCTPIALIPTVYKCMWGWGCVWDVGSYLL